MENNCTKKKKHFANSCPTRAHGEGPNSGGDSCFLGYTWSTTFLRGWGAMRVVSLVLLIFIQPLGGMENDILRLNIPSEPELNPNTVCKTHPALTPHQYELCNKHPDVTSAAIQGIQIAVHECQFQLRTQRWNCSTLEKRNKNPHSSPLLQKGYRETAFAYAVSAAGVTHQVAKACSLGKLKSCGCDMSKHGKVQQKWEWGGCSHNVQYGEQFAHKFLDAKEKAKDIHAKINLHNNRAGRLAVIRNVQRKCKCHGMSGSCELKTCWKATPEFRDVGDILKRKYEKASKIMVSNHVTRKIRRRLGGRPRHSELIFYEKSPSFCEPNPKVDSLGTFGRLCNKTSTGVDNCETLCCGRGYDTLKVRRTERCNCKFHWCCYVKCETCTYNEWVTVCK